MSEKRLHLSRFWRLGRALAAICAAALAPIAPSAAEEGMWTFDNFPTTRMREIYDWAPDQSWLDRVRLGSVRLESGCSGGLVSNEGLVQTNQHCIVSCLQSLSTAEDDVLQAGVRAMSRGEERRCPGLAAQILVSITDVTLSIEAAAANVPPTDFPRALSAEMRRLTEACRAAAPQNVCRVVTLYQGGRYSLYQYKRYEDVRVAFAPEMQAAFFGGAPDNFNFPRYSFDAAFLRLYENERPAQTPNYLRWRTTPLADGELTFNSGHPGGTSRQMTSAQLAFQRDYFLPWRLDHLAELRGRLSAFSARGPQEALAVGETLFDIENSFKALRGRRLALADEAGFAFVMAREAELRERASHNPAQSRALNEAMAQIAAATAAQRSFFIAHQMAEPRAGAGSRLFLWARDIVRAADERAQPNEARLSIYTDARLPAVERDLLSTETVAPALEEILLSFWLTKLREGLAPDDPLVRRILGDESPEALAARLVAGTQLNDPAVRRALWEGGEAAVAASSDPMIVFVRAWDGDARALRSRFERDVEGPIARAQERLAQIRFQTYGASAYPDATFTLRLSYGRVTGWTEADGRAIGPFTRFDGLFARATNAAPFQLAPSWAAAQARLNPQTILNFTTAHDIINGNSGSPVLDRDGRVVGVAFDGNMHSLAGEYFYDGARNRAVSVASTAVLEALVTVYGMNRLAAELQRP
ncbi:MAG: S46 family peptidase [Hyphomonadaceae bacterium]